MNLIKVAAFFDEFTKIAMSGMQMRGINNFLSRVSGASGKAAIKHSPKTLVIGKSGIKRLPHPGRVVAPPPIPAGA